MHNANSRLMLLGILLVTLIGCGKVASASELKDKILFLSEQGICTINPDGTDLKLIVPLKPEERNLYPNPKWSPDKQRIAFTALVEGHAHIVTVNYDGSNKKVISLPLTSCGFMGWSTSGKFLIYREEGVLDATPFGVISTEGEVIARLNGVYASFGGKDLLVYEDWYRAGGSDILAYDLNTKENSNLTKTRDKTLTEYYPAPSPDGKLIVFQSAILSKREIWIMNSDGSGERKLINSDEGFKGVAWGGLKFSPNGRKIMFVPDEGSSSQIYIINADGTGLKAITDKIVKASGGVSWSSDGKKIVFTSNKDGNDELYIINVDGTDLRRLTNSNFNNCCPDWYSGR